MNGESDAVEKLAEMGRRQADYFQAWKNANNKKKSKVDVYADFGVGETVTREWKSTSGGITMDQRPRW